MTSESNAILLHPMAAAPSPIDQATWNQNKAAYPHVSAWVDASAGSGKTKVLIDRVLRLLLAGVEANKILCLTFTKAAAANMANRLIKTLGSWVTMPEPALAEQLFKLTQTEPSDAEINAARRLFAATMDVAGGLQFQTIHSFCQSLLTRFPLEAGVPVGFNILEERLSGHVQAEARLRILSSGKASAALDYLLETLGEKAFKELSKNILAQRGKFEAVLSLGLQGACAHLRHILEVPEGAQADDVLLAFVADPTRSLEAYQPIIQAFFACTPRLRAFGEVLADWAVLPLPQRVDKIQDYMDIFITNKNEPRKQLLSKNAEEIYPDCAALLQAEQEKVCALQRQLVNLKTYEASRTVMAYAALLFEEYAALKKKRMALDYDDLIERAAHLVHNHASAWVLYKLDGGIEHLLVDEAQDTNPRQWALLEMLVDDFYSGNAAKTYTPPRSVFAVGDYKQSIFSFQGADPEAFAAAKERLRARIATPEHFRAVQFNVSFRTVSAVLDVVDATFKNPLAQHGLRHYAPHASVWHNMAGRVDCWPLPPVDDDLKTSPKLKLARTLAHQIKAWVEGQEMLPARNRPITYGDILILVRSRGEMVPEIIRTCKQIDVPVAGADRMILGEQLVVEDLLSFLQFLLLPEDDLNLACLLKSPLIGMDEETLFTLSYDRKQSSLWRQMQVTAAHQSIVVWLSNWLKMADRITPYALLAQLLAQGCPAQAHSSRRAFLARLGEEANDPMDELLAMALAYEGQEAPSLQGFVRFMQKDASEIKREMEQHGNKVRIMTVHGSKGLESPVVIVVDSVTKNAKHERLLLDVENPAAPPLLALSGQATDEGKRRKQAWEEHRRAEENRLLYVALTRAEDWLIMAGFGHNKAKKVQKETETLSEKALQGWYYLTQAGIAAAGGQPHDFALSGTHGWGGQGYRLEHQGTAVRREKHAHAAPFDAARNPLPVWIDASPPAEPQPSVPLMPSRMAAEDEPAALSPLGDDTGWRYQRGQTIHRLLQTLPDLPASQWRTAAERFLQPMPATKAQSLIEEVIAVLEHPQFAPLFGAHSRAEVPVTGVVDGKVLAGRIDRLAVDAQYVWIVDYKTNRPPPQEVAQVHKSYLQQLAAYKAALQPIYPQHIIRTLLLWTDVPRLMEIPAEML